MNKPKQKTLRNKADALFSKIIRMPGRCHCCGRVDRPLQCAHIVSRRYFATRWDEDNALCLCIGDHKFFTHHPIEWDNYIMAQGIDLDSLKRRALVIASPIDYAAIIERLTARLTELEAVS